MKPKAGRSWGKSRPRHTLTKLRQAMQLRRAGGKLRDIQKKTGVSPSYLSRLMGSMLEAGKGRTLGLLKTESLAILRTTLGKLEREAREVRAQIKKLTTEPKIREGA